MCFLIEVALPSLPRERAGQLSRQVAAQPGLLELRAQRQPKKEPGSRFLVCERSQGCACSLLADAADPEKPFFDLEPARAAALAATLRYLAAQAPDGFDLRSGWVTGAWGETAPPGRTLSLRTILDHLRRNRLPAAVHARLRPAG